MKTYLTLSIIVLVLVITIVMMTPARKPGNGSQESIAWFIQESNIFAASATSLKQSLGHVDTKDAGSVANAKTALKKCRLQYKHISFFLEYFFSEEAKIYNGPPVQEVESALEFREPLGLQVVESFLFSEDPASRREEMVIQADMLARRAASFAPLLNNFKATDGDVLESLNLELVRIMTLYITGYDAPESKTGIEEAHESLATIDKILTPFIRSWSQKDSIEYYMATGKQYLKTHTDFDSFDRLFFITNYALPIERQLNKFIIESTKEPDLMAVLNSHSRDLFAPEALDKKAFPHTEDEADHRIVDLGKELFFEKSLSGNFSRSCGSCHLQGAFFSDRLSQNRTMDGTGHLLRNTPSLLYASYQFAQFWDGRAASLEDQVTTVLKSKPEMNSSADTIIQRLNNDPVYVNKFKKIWSKNEGVNFQHVAGALAAYIRTLTPFQSPFDHYIRGDQTALSPSQKRGFNLFMGKAQCGTCHFAPLFNGLLPPVYNTTEFEVLGTPANDNLEHPIPDLDEGRYALGHNAVYKGAFKTPTLRNAAVTAPYMHNGNFNSLEKVVDFYDKGGGAGLGLPVSEQTLSSKPLNLNEQEKKDIIAFIESLTDK